jgi:NAD(P)-dependent dehydrogenase (short-subunit alcohol dehydrogenase family)
MDRVVLITGGGSGIGKACAGLFRENGDRVYILGRTEAKLRAAREELNAKNGGPAVEYIVADVADTARCESAVAEVIAKEQRLDILVNSAGAALAGPAAAVTEADWDRVTDTNLKGTFFMCRYAIPHLTASRGCIVNISSDAGVVGNGGLAVYCASKGGVTVMTKALALELAPLGVRANSVCPTETDTDMLARDVIEYGYASREEYEKALAGIYPQGEKARFVKPEEVAEAVLFLADNKKAAAITGTELMVDFGVTAGY